ncbi:MAG: NUDIX domain-containing protein, partial [Bacteroidales bacterium]|nr:NUDIX domain-containing protein [Bacteroidales bacterium]
MLDLIYQLDEVPFVGRRQAGDEIVPVVERSGIVTGKTSRRNCHIGGTKLLHPVVHLHIVNRDGEMFLQRRSEFKDIHPLKWDMAVGGHVGYGEMLPEALVRESSEEIGLRDFNPVQIYDYVYESDMERELVAVYATVGNFSITPDSLEVIDGCYWTVN